MANAQSFMRHFKDSCSKGSHLREERSPGNILELAKVFASRIVRYDFWNDTDTWEVVSHFGKPINHFLLTGDATHIRLDPKSDDAIQRYKQERPHANRTDVKATDILRLCDLLASLSGNYEDVCREWFLPTAMGYLTGYGSPEGHSFEGKFGKPRLGNSTR